MTTCSSVADVPDDLAAVLAQVEDRVDDELAGAVEGDVAAAVGVVEGGAEFGETIGGQAQVGLVAGAACREDGSVLEEEQGVVALATAYFVCRTR